MSIDPTALRNVLALASDHLRGSPLPAQSPETMAGVWSQIAALASECRALEESNAAIAKAAPDVLAAAPPVAN